MLIPLALAMAGLGFTAIIFTRRPAKLKINYVATASTPVDVPTTRYVTSVTIPSEFLPKAAAGDLPKILASASKWAKARGIPYAEVLATIHVESKGNKKARAYREATEDTRGEDSRGLMQVNIDAWRSKLTNRGYAPSDLYDIDKNIEIGTEIYANYRKIVADLITQSGKLQAAPLATIVRQYYRGPATVKKAILAGNDASTVFAASDARAGRGNSVANWQIAMHYASGVTSA